MYSFISSGGPKSTIGSKIHLIYTGESGLFGYDDKFPSADVAHLTDLGWEISLHGCIHCRLKIIQAASLQRTTRHKTGNSCYQQPPVNPQSNTRWQQNVAKQFFFFFYITEERRGECESELEKCSEKRNRWVGDTSAVQTMIMRHTVSASIKRRLRKWFFLVCKWW